MIELIQLWWTVQNIKTDLRCGSKDRETELSQKGRSMKGQQSFRHTSWQNDSQEIIPRGECTDTATDEEEEPQSMNE